MMKSFLADASGATALEEALVAAFIAGAILGALALGGAKLYATLMEVVGAIDQPAVASTR